jgi:hypothetical protein
LLLLPLNRSSRRTLMSLPDLASGGIYAVPRTGHRDPSRIYTLCRPVSRQELVLRSWRSKKVQFSLLKFAKERSEAKMSVYHAYIVGSHSRFIGAVQMDCVDDAAAIKSASRLVDRHDVELWQMDRPVVRFDAASKQMFKKRTDVR